MGRYQLDKALWGGAEQFDALLAEIVERREEFERQHFISDDIVDKFRDVGIYRAFVPREFGGSEVTPIEFLLAIEAIAEADGSAGWVASFGVCESYLGGLPLDVVEQIWAKPDAVFAGAMFPLQPATRVEDRFVLSGRWKWASGCMSADRIGVGIMPDTEGAHPRMAVLDPDQVTIDTESWNAHGMAGSGSFDIVIDHAEVPIEHTFVRGGPLNPSGPFFRYPTIAIAGQVLAVTSLGIARAAVDLVLHGDRHWQSATGAPSIGDRAHAQMELGKAEARLRASRLFFYDAIDEAWETLVRGDELTMEMRSMLRLSCTHVTRECAEVVRIAYALSGMQASYYDNHLSRCWRDVHMPTQHAFMGEVMYQNAGAVLFDREPGPGYL